MLTPKYGLIKQNCYRNVINQINLQAFKTKAVISVSLGGAHCLENPDSNERSIIANNPHSIVIIVEYDLKSVKNLLKSLTKVRREKRGFNYAYIAKMGTVTIEVYYGTLRHYLIWAATVSRKHHVVIADYYSTLNRKVIEDLKLLRGERLTAKNARLFITSADPRRAITQDICQLVLNRDTNTGNKSYKGGMRQYLKAFFTSKHSKVKDIIMHNYTNCDVSKKAIEMYVAIMHLA